MEKKDFYAFLGIPESKLSLDTEGFTGCQFYLRKHDYSKGVLEVITLHEFPKGKHLRVKLPTKSTLADSTYEIEVTKELILDLVNQRFEWMHISEENVLW